MKRLYGDMEAHSVYREMRSVNGGEQLQQHQQQPQQTEQQSVNNPLESHNLFSSLEYNIRVGSGLATVQSAREPVSKFEKQIEIIFWKQKSADFFFRMLDIC